MTLAMRLFLENVVNSFGDCTVSVSYFDGEIALENVQSIKPDVILLDLEMPKMDGIEAFYKIRDIDAAAKIILVSAYVNDDQEIENAKNNGLLQMENKPVGIKKLEELIAKYD